MANLIEVKIPNLGEAEDTEIIEISIKVGDSVSKNDPLIVLESEKAAMEVPSDYEGKVKEIKVKEGDNVSEGTSIAAFSDSSTIKGSFFETESPTFTEISIISVSSASPKLGIFTSINFAMDFPFLDLIYFHEQIGVLPYFY